MIVIIIIVIVIIMNIIWGLQSYPSWDSETKSGRGLLETGRWQPSLTGSERHL